MFKFSESRNRYTIVVNTPFRFAYLLASSDEVVRFLTSDDGLGLKAPEEAMKQWLDTQEWVKDQDNNDMMFSYLSPEHSFSIFRLSVCPTLG